MLETLRLSLLALSFGYIEEQQLKYTNFKHGSTTVTMALQALLTGCCPRNLTAYSLSTAVDRKREME